jgi:hypothetical protein
VHTKKTFLKCITALTLQIHPQSTTIQWLYSTWFSVLTPSRSPQSTPKGLASVTCTISTFRRSGSRTRVGILTASATSPLTPGGTKPPFLKPRHRYPRDEARESHQDRDNRSEGQQEPADPMDITSNTARGKEDQGTDCGSRKECRWRNDV